MKIGDHVLQSGGFRAFVPSRFPPAQHLDLTPEMEVLLARASQLIGKLDGITQTLPDVDFFIFMYVRKEAALSSEIEGTRATMIDAIRAEIEITQDLPKDVDRILHYIEAMNVGLKRLEKLPLSLRFIKEVHRTLTSGATDARGSNPGEFRRTQNWIGGTRPDNARYVPPPVPDMARALDEFEKFLHATDAFPALVKTALAHAQFETIHPFLDGNGRTGRLLVTFYLCQQGILERPVLYLSEYLKRHRELYFDLLGRYHEQAAVLPWLTFFLEGVADVAADAIETSRRINDLRRRDLGRIHRLGKRTRIGLEVLDKLYTLPIVSVAKVEEWTRLSRPAANALVREFTRIGILQQRNAQVRYRRDFEYRDYLKLFAAGPG